MCGLRVHPARVLANRPFEAAGKCSTGRGPVLLRGPTGQRLNAAQPLPLGSLAQFFLASSGTAPLRSRSRGVCPNMPGRLPRLSPARAFPLGLGLS